jgi:hypothetical protein
MKQYVTHGTGSAQTLSEVQNTNVVVYDTKADAEADLTNLAEGQIVATKDTGDELAQPVNEVTLNNLHSVTSNAVAQALSSLIKVKKVTFNNVVLNQNGVLNIESYIPSDINLLFALMWNWSAVSMDNYFGVSGDGRYIRGTPNNTIDYIVVAYFYVD